MIRKILLYFKLQFKFFVILCLICLLPLWAFYQFANFKVDYIYLGFFAILLIIRLLQPKEDHYRKIMTNKILHGLEKELNQTPNTNQIVKRSNEYVESRDFAIIFVAALIFLITIYFGKI